MIFNHKVEVVLKGEKKTKNHGLLISESGDTFSGKILKGRVDGQGL